MLSQLAWHSIELLYLCQMTRAEVCPGDFQAEPQMVHEAPEYVTGRTAAPVQDRTGQMDVSVV
jgi:hypothetical protein